VHAEWSKNGREMKDIQLAITTLEAEVAREEVRRQQEAAAPLFEASQAFVPQLAKAFAEMEKLLRAKEAALDAFDRAHVDHPDVRPSYDPYALLPLRGWFTAAFVGDFPGDDRSQLERWRLECRERGYKI
jgi:hypothetical protein